MSHAAFHADAVGFLRARAAEGDATPFRLGRQRYLLLTHPDAIQAVLETQAAAFRKRRGKQLLGEGLLTSEGEHHDRQRQLVAPAFHGQRLQGYAATIVERTQAAMAPWGDGQVLDLDRTMPALMLDVIGRVLFGAAIAPHAATITAALDTILGLSSRITHPWGGLLNVLPLLHADVQPDDRPAPITWMSPLAQLIVAGNR